MTGDGAGKGARTPVVSLDGYHGSLADLLTLARAHQVDLTTISIVALVDQLATAVQDAPPATPLAQKGDWLVMAAWLLQLRSRLLLPAEAPALQVAQETAGRFRKRLTGLAEIQALAAWLDGRPQLGRDVFVRGQQLDNIDPTNETAPDIDVIEFLWASMALFGDGSPAADISEAYRPPACALFSIPEARTRILQRLAGTPEGLVLEHLLPDAPAMEERPSLRKRGAWSSTLIAGLELAKQGEVILAQAEPFSAIQVRPAPAEPA